METKSYHDSVFLFAGVVTLVQILIAVRFVIRWQGLTLKFTQLVEWTRPAKHKCVIDCFISVNVKLR